MQVQRTRVVTTVLLLLSFVGCARMKQNAIYGAATDDSWRCPRDLTSIQDFGDHRYRLMGCGWLSDYECEIPLQFGGIGSVVSGTSCRALTPPIPIH